MPLERRRPWTVFPYFALFAMCALGGWVECQYPVLYTSPTENGTIVEDKESGELISGKGAFHLFVCSPQQRANMSLPCSRNIQIHSRSRRPALMLSRIHENGTFATLSSSSSHAYIEAYFVDDQGFRADVNVSVLEVEDVYVPFVLELGDVGENVDLVRVRATIENMTVSVPLSLDVTPPTVSFTQLHFQGNESDERVWVNLRPSEAMFANNPHGSCECALPQINLTSEEKLNAQELLSRSRQCSGNNAIETALPAVHIEGGYGSEWITVGDESIAGIAVNASRPEDIKISLANTSVCDYSGNLNRDPVNFTIFYRPTVGVPSKERKRRLIHRSVELKKQRRSETAGKVIGQMASAAVGSAIASSSANAAGGGGGGQSIPVFLLNMLQKLYFTGNLAVNNMPEMYADFATQLTWVMFDFASPFDKFVNRRNCQESDLEPEECASQAQDQWGSIDGAYLYFARVFFWVPLILLCLLFLHFLLICFSFWRKKRVPHLLTFPRIEIMFSYWAMPAVAAASAGLLHGNRRDALIAVWLLVMLPGGLAAWNIYMLWRYFYSKDPRNQSAHFVVFSSSKPTKTVVRWKKDWQRMRKMKRENKRNPPVMFLNDAYGLSHIQQQAILPMYAQRESLSFGSLPDKRPSTDVVDRDRPASSTSPTSPKVLHRHRGLQFGEIQPDTMQECELSPVSGRGSVNLNRVSEQSTTTAAAESSYSNNRELSRMTSSNSGRTAPAEFSSVGNSIWDDPQPSSDFPVLSIGSSINDLNYTSGDDCQRSTSVELKSLSDLAARVPRDNSIKQKSAKHSMMKYTPFDRLQSETSNNLAAVITQQRVLSSLPSRAREIYSHDSLGRSYMMNNVSRTDSDLSAILRFDSLEGKRQLSFGNDRRASRTLSGLTEKPYWPEAFTMQCSDAPEAAWKQFLSPDDYLAEKSTPAQSLTHPSSLYHAESSRTVGMKPLSRISESSAERGSPLVLLNSSSSKSHASKSVRQPSSFLPTNIPHEATSIVKTRGQFFGERLFDHQLGISVLDPEPYTETEARLKHINNECLLEAGLSHLINTDSSSSDSDDKSELEYEQLSRELAKQDDKSISGWKLCGELCDIGFFSLFMGSQQSKGRWVASHYGSRDFIVKYGYLFEDFRGLPVLHRPPTYEVVDSKLDRGKFIPLRIKPLLSWKAWTIPGTHFQIPGLAVYHHQIQILTRFLQVMKVVLLGMSVAGVGSGYGSAIQIAVLFFACTLLLITLRITCPYRSRIEMAISLSEEAADVMFLALIAVLLLGPNSDQDFRQRVGAGLVTVECLSVLAIVSHQIFISVRGFARMHIRRKRRKVSKLTTLFRRYLSRNEYFIQRKYFDKWMVKALKRGLYLREPERTELPRNYFIRQQITKTKASLSWISEELMLIKEDLSKKIRSALHFIRKFRSFTTATT